MLLLYASEVAALIGKNPYKPQWEAFEQLWARFQPEQYATHQEGKQNYVALELDKIQTRAVVSANAHQATTTDDVQAIEKQVVAEVSKQAGVEAEARVVQAAAALNVHTETSDMQTLMTLAEMSHNDAAKQLLQEASEFVKQRDAVASKAASAVRCAFGTRKEDTSRQQLIRQTKVQVNHDNRFHSLRLGTMPYARMFWGIGGRLDGLDAQGRVVEIKNRTRRFFSVIPEYERVQVACYLKLTGSPCALLVQQFNGEQRTTEIQDEAVRWQQYLTLMTSVVHVMDMFASDDNVTLREAWVECYDGVEKQSLLTQWLVEQKEQEKHETQHYTVSNEGATDSGLADV